MSSVAPIENVAARVLGSEQPESGDTGRSSTGSSSQGGAIPLSESGEATSEGRSSPPSDEPSPQESVGTDGNPSRPPEADSSSSSSSETDTSDSSGDNGSENESNSSDSTPAERDLDPRERQRVEELRDKDEKVRKHEQAHLSTAGQYVRGGLQFEFRRGPDGNRYAVGGSVNLDVSRESQPDRTIQKMRQVRAAALAPAQPSPKDLQVAQSATKKAAQARERLQEQRQEEMEETREKIQETTEEITSDDESSGSSSDPAPVGPRSPDTTRADRQGTVGTEPSRRVEPSPANQPDGGGIQFESATPTAERESPAPEIEIDGSGVERVIEELEIVNGSSGTQNSSTDEFDTSPGAQTGNTATLGTFLDFSA